MLTNLLHIGQRNGTGVCIMYGVEILRSTIFMDCPLQDFAQIIFADGESQIK